MAIATQLSSLYHAARLRRPEKYQQLRRTILQVFEANKRRYGYRRIGVVLRRSGEAVSEKVIRRIMSEDGLTVCTRRRGRYASYNGEITPAVDCVDGMIVSWTIGKSPTEYRTSIGSAA